MGGNEAFLMSSFTYLVELKESKFLGKVLIVLHKGALWIDRIISAMSTNSPLTRLLIGFMFMRCLSESARPQEEKKKSRRSFFHNTALVLSVKQKKSI